MVPPPKKLKALNLPLQITSVRVRAVQRSCKKTDFQMDPENIQGIRKHRNNYKGIPVCHGSFKTGKLDIHAAPAPERNRFLVF
jgi:hypothetical protein